ncbi:transcription factor [Sarracenia purpurea var. burkii]
MVSDLWCVMEYVMQDIVLCKIYRKATSKKVLEERAAMEEERKTAHSLEPSLTLPMETISFCSQCKEYSAAPMAAPHVAFKKELDVVITEEIGYEEADDQSRRRITTSLQLPPGNEKLPELEVPRFSTDWTQDSFWSPWLNNLTPYANLLNF